MIRCERCKKILDHNDPLNVEWKICVKCVVATHQEEPEQKILKSNGSRYRSEDDLREKLKSITIELEYVLLDGEPHANFVLKDYFKKPFFTFVMNRQKIRDILLDLEDIAREEAKSDTPVVGDMQTGNDEADV